MNACLTLSQLADRLAAEHSLEPKQFLQELGRRAAGIDPGVAGLWDLIRGGQDLLGGKGFLPEYDDGSGGQVRHFVGIAVAVLFFGPLATREASIHIRRDAPGSPDGRLTDCAIDFATRLLEGRLHVAEAGAWLRRHVCLPVEQGGPEGLQG